MKNKWFTLAMGLLLMIGVSIVALGVVNWRGQRGVPASTVTWAQSAQSQPAQSGAVQIAGNYSGAVKLHGTVGGVFSDTLATPPPPGAGTPTAPDLGSIDLSLQLTQTGNALSGYVSLDKTLVYSVEHTLGTGAASVKIGPFVNGVFDGANLTLQSEKVVLVVSGRAVQRQFRLTGTSTASDGGQVSGEYRETLWGYASVPVTVIGSFTLQRPGFGSNVPLPNNQAPTVVADTATTAQGVAVTLNVLANDTAANGGALTITSVSKPQFGAATTNGQTVTYTPNANFIGNDTFSYVVIDQQGGTATGSVSITVTGPGGPNQAPTAANDSATTTPGVAVTIDVLANDSDPDGDALTITIDGPPSHGTATVNNGKVVYTPQAGFTGTDSFTYIVSDGKGGTATATVTITVTGSGNPNRAPTAANDTATTPAGVAVTIDVLANDADPDGDALTIATVTPPANGTATVNNGRVVYTPNASFVGSDSFTYTITDGKGGSATATVTITVTDQPGGGSNSLYLPLIQR